MVDISPIESPSGLVGSRGNLSSSPFWLVFPDVGSLLRQDLPSGAAQWPTSGLCHVLSSAQQKGEILFPDSHWLILGHVPMPESITIAWS